MATGRFAPVLFLVLVVVMLGSGHADAFTLGKLQVFSRLGDPLKAGVDIRPESGEKDFQAALGSPSDYGLLHLDRSPLLDRIRVAVVPAPEGARIVLDSTSPLETAGFHLLLRISSNQRTSFPVFRMDLPPPPTPSVVRVASGPDRRAAARTVAEPPRREAARPEQTYGPIKTGEHLTGIARAVRQDTGLSVFKIMAAIVARNPDRFIQGNMNSLIEGSTLVIPPPEVIGRINLREARLLRLQHARHWLQPREERRRQPAPAPPELVYHPVAQPAPAPVPTAEPSAPAAVKSVPDAVDSPATDRAADSRVAAGTGRRTVPDTTDRGGTRSGETREAGRDTPGLEAILEQLRVITRVLEDNKGQWNRLEERVATLETGTGAKAMEQEPEESEQWERLEQRLTELEQARKEWDMLEGRVTELELSGPDSTVIVPPKHNRVAPQPADASLLSSLPPMLFQDRFYLIVAASVAGVGLLLAALLIWMGRRWNQADHWHNLRALLSSVASQEPDLLVDALKETEPVFDQAAFVPSFHSHATPTVRPQPGKRTIAGDAGHAAERLHSISENRIREHNAPV